MSSDSSSEGSGGEDGRQRRPTRRVWSAPGDDAPGPLRVDRQGARLLRPLLRAAEEERAAGQRDAQPAAVRAASRGRGRVSSTMVDVCSMIGILYNFLQNIVLSTIYIMSMYPILNVFTL